MHTGTITIPIRVRVVGLTAAKWQAAICWLLGIKYEIRA
jgi:hypothetical protein